MTIFFASLRLCGDIIILYLTLSGFKTLTGSLRCFGLQFPAMDDVVLL
jgi:hypothetical protein